MISRYGAWPVALVALGLAGTGLFSYHDVVQKQDAEGATSVAQQQLSEVADPLKQLCDTDPSIRARVGPACDSAAAAVADPQVQQAVRDGHDGVGIASTSLRAGHLVVAYSDGSSRDVGQVVGADGRGVASTVLEDGHLVLVLTDGTRTDLGVVVGPAGRGVASASTAAGRLVLTLDDGTTVDAGPLPKGDKGDTGEKGDTGQEGGPGAPGPACPDGFQPVETGPVVGADGRSYSRSITCVDPTSASTGGDGQGSGDGGG